MSDTRNGQVGDDNESGTFYDVYHQPSQKEPDS